MRRRDLIALLGGAAVALPRAVIAQAPERMRRIGVLMAPAESNPDAQAQLTAFRDRLQQLGWADGRNLQIEVRWAGGDIGRVQRFARELVALQPDVIVGRATPVTAALLHETHTIPIVFLMTPDPVGEGFVASLARPGGNVTGFTYVESSLGSKWLELLKQIAPRLTRAAFIYDPGWNAGGGLYYLRSIEAAAPSFAVQVIAASVHDAADIERAINAFAREPNSGLLVSPDTTPTLHRQLIIELAARYRLPAIYGHRTIIAEGGLISYGSDIVDLGRRAASYVDSILRGAQPGELPVQAPTRFELAINLRTARALGIEIPPHVLALADEVIE
jgi:putative ABC transport system substrate-binding protein